MRAEDREAEARLVREAQAGSETAFRALAGRWGRKLIAHAWRLTGDHEEARDVAQAAWVEIARGLDRLRDPIAFPAWAYRITTRQAAALIRRRRSDRRLARALEHAAATSTERASSGEPQSDAVAVLRLAIRQLPAHQRAALALHHLEELSVAEVAVALDTPVGTIKTRLMHARLKLRAILEGDARD